MARNKTKIHQNDTVKVISGKNKGAVAKVVRVMPENQTVVLEGVAVRRKHVKPQQDQAGRIVEIERPIHISNVALWNTSEGRTVKVGFRVNDDGTKVRVDRKTGAALDS